ncbi:hypothetical protein AciX8_2396 [Granulicella mallensis MP5ACTX8]|uniref:Uncharacterized protein n=1 Tax=Granulicella mallensis (strain ATCC BAA-1857 / DSM 23137 / MP5ACTX8) TaxID=682795 RepID=G8NY39_GRAMM|nr:hypothetical protein AciX8_2396 [Granulicella mallensis MP5ACTX8]
MRYQYMRQDASQQFCEDGQLIESDRYAYCRNGYLSNDNSEEVHAYHFLSAMVTKMVIVTKKQANRSRLACS